MELGLNRLVHTGVSCISDWHMGTPPLPSDYLSNLNFLSVDVQKKRVKDCSVLLKFATTCIKHSKERWKITERAFAMG